LVTINEAETQIDYGSRGSTREAYNKYSLSEPGYASVLQAITRLRQACCDPEVIKKSTATKSGSLDNSYSDSDDDAEAALVLPTGVQTLLDALPQGPSSKIAKLLDALSKIRQGSPMLDSSFSQNSGITYRPFRRIYVEMINLSSYISKSLTLTLDKRLSTDSGIRSR